MAISLRIARNLLAPLKPKDFKLKRSKKLTVSFQATPNPSASLAKLRAFERKKTRERKMLMKKSSNLGVKTYFSGFLWLFYQIV